MWHCDITTLIGASALLIALTGCANQPTERPIMTTESSHVIAINVIRVAPSNQKVVANLQLELVEKIKRSWPGFLSQKTLVAADGTKVTTVEEYASMDSLLAIVHDAGLLAYRQKIVDAGGSMDAAVYKQWGDAKAQEPAR